MMLLRIPGVRLAVSTAATKRKRKWISVMCNERERAVGMFIAGMTQTKIANHFNCSRMTIYRLLVRVRATGTTSDRRRSGRPREATLRQDRHITLIHLRFRFVAAVDTARRTPGIRNNIISDQPVRNRLR
jgi:DNA-binding CsgD family transcriptional regulator